MISKLFWPFLCLSIFIKKQKSLKNQNKFVGNLRSFGPPPPELNFRHCTTVVKMHAVYVKKTKSELM